MKRKRRICVVTGSRAEYGLLYWLMKEIAGDTDLELQLLVTGAHLSADFGSTYREIEADGFRIDAKVEMVQQSDSPASIAKSIGLGVTGCGVALENLEPDIMVVLGDRYEILAAATAAMVARVPIAHIHGGESSEGNVDEAIRHAVTKMSHLHFTAAEPYRARVIQLGESPDRVFNFGALGLDSLDGIERLTGAALEKELGFSLSERPLLLCTYHPETLGDIDVASAMRELLMALDRFPRARVAFTKANADTGGRVINQLIDDYAALNPKRVSAFTSLGQRRYLSLLLESDAVVGNSSSAIIEAPAAKTPTVNIGDRQRGRLKSPSIIDCDTNAAAIAAAITKALSPEFQTIAARGESLFGTGGASTRIKEVLKRTPLEGILRKAFHTVDHPALTHA